MIPPRAYSDPSLMKKYAARQLKASTHPYKRAFWRLTMMLGRLPTTRDKEFWDLPGFVRGLTS